MAKLKLRSNYSNDYRDEAQEFKEESLTNQAFKAMTDINYLVANFNGAPVTPQYGEQINWTSEEWQNIRAKIRQRFNDLTPDEKARFKNPAEFFAYCTNPENYQIKRGKYEEKPKEQFPPAPSSEEISKSE